MLLRILSKKDYFRNNFVNAGMNIAQLKITLNITIIIFGILYFFFEEQNQFLNTLQYLDYASLTGFKYNGMILI